MNGDALLAIGELAQRTGIPVKTIRYWSDRGLMPPAGRSPAGYRLYDGEAAARLDLIRTLRALGVGLDSVRGVLDRETTFPEVAAAHAEALAVQIRALRLRHAVLTAAAESAAAPEELEELHRLATLPEAERHRLVDDFLATVLTPDGEPPTPFAPLAASLRPELPAEPTPEQIRAWAELAGLVRENGFRASLRGMADEYGAEHPASVPPRADIVAVACDLAGPALAAGTDPAAPEAAAVADALAAHQATLLGRPDGPDLRHRLAARLERAADPCWERYLRLLAVVNGWPAPESRSPALAWSVQALRTLRTDTLVLRPWRDEDAPAVASAHRGDPALRRWATHRMEDDPAALDWIHAQRDAWTEETRHAFAVAEPGPEGALLGGVVLKRPGEVGYWTAPEARGRSVAPRALAALTAWAFTALAPHAPDRLELLHQADNTASCRVAEKCGYPLTHHLPPAPPAYPEEGHVHVRER
ncbi:GNAT family N-acetyltransferase [Streptomyces sp. NPDC048172]|uniref:GNAT family N-acetyltransferase n=1 Tax=Streptomyces sp. NPDC048172 TaxID=3365505 RepID=UPI0037184C9E